MGKKIKNAKLLKQTPAAGAPEKSAFNNFATKLQQAKEKKIEKLSHTKERLVNQKRENKLLRLPGNVKKAKKFSLLDEDAAPAQRLTHKGKNIGDIQHFNDMYFGSGDQDSMNDQLHNQVNFEGFQEQDKSGKIKSKKQVYEEIIQKSRKHKHERQEQYEENFNAAVDLDEQFPDFVRQLKFRTQDTKVREKIEGKDLDYERLMNELKEDERVVASRVVDNNKKGADKVKKKKNEQLCKLMNDADVEQGEDIRGWVNELSEFDSQGDQLDDVALSSGDDDSDEQNEEQQEMSNPIQVLEEQSSEEEGAEGQDSEENSQQEQDSEEQLDQQSEQESEEQPSESPQQKKKKPITKNNKNKKGGRDTGVKYIGRIVAEQKQSNNKKPNPNPKPNNNSNKGKNRK